MARDVVSHQVDTLARPQVVGERSYAGFNPARRENVTLFRAILQGDHLLHGFRNRHIRQQLFAATEGPRERRRQANAVSRLLKRLHVSGLIAKVPRTRRWQVTTGGQEILGSCVRLYYHGLSTAAYPVATVSVFRARSRIRQQYQVATEA